MAWVTMSFHLWAYEVLHKNITIFYRFIFVVEINLNTSWLDCGVEIIMLFEISPRIAGLTFQLLSVLCIFKGQVLFLFHLNGLRFSFSDIIFSLRHLGRLFVEIIRVQNFFMGHVFCQTARYFFGALRSEYHCIWLFLAGLELIPLNIILTFFLVAELKYTWHLHSLTMLWWDRPFFPNLWYLPVHILLFNNDGFFNAIFISLSWHETTLCIINQIWFSLLRNIFQVSLLAGDGSVLLSAVCNSSPIQLGILYEICEPSWDVENYHNDNQSYYSVSNLVSIFSLKIPSSTDHDTISND